MQEQLILPVRHEWLVREPAYGKLALEPFEPGFALTAGNAYRRVLLSSIHGAAPTWVRIESVLHEFSHLQGMTEDTLDVLMNLRRMVFALHVNRPKIPAPGPGPAWSRQATSSQTRRGYPHPDIVMATSTRWPDRDAVCSSAGADQRRNAGERGPADKRHAPRADFSPVSG